MELLLWALTKATTTSVPSLICALLHRIGKAISFTPKHSIWTQFQKYSLLDFLKALILMWTEINKIQNLIGAYAVLLVCWCIMGILSKSPIIYQFHFSVNLASSFLHFYTRHLDANTLFEVFSSILFLFSFLTFP